MIHLKKAKFLFNKIKTYNQWIIIIKNKINKKFQIFCNQVEIIWKEEINKEKKYIKSIMKKQMKLLNKFKNKN